MYRHIITGTLVCCNDMKIYPPRIEIFLFNHRKICFYDSIIINLLVFFNFETGKQLNRLIEPENLLYSANCFSIEG
jgi:hypothetical protein